MGEWLPIESAPFDTPILVFGHWRPTWTDPEPRMAVWERDSRDKDRMEGLRFYCKEINGDVSHWMPLPEPPSQRIEPNG